MDKAEDRTATVKNIRRTFAPVAVIAAELLSIPLIGMLYGLSIRQAMAIALWSVIFMGPGLLFAGGYLLSKARRASLLLIGALLYGLYLWSQRPFTQILAQPAVVSWMALILASEIHRRLLGPRQQTVREILSSLMRSPYYAGATVAIVLNIVLFASFFVMASISMFGGRLTGAFFLPWGLNLTAATGLIIAGLRSQKHPQGASLTGLLLFLLMIPCGVIFLQFVPVNSPDGPLSLALVPIGVLALVGISLLFAARKWSHFYFAGIPVALIFLWSSFHFLTEAADMSPTPSCVAVFKLTDPESDVTIDDRGTGLAHKLQGQMWTRGWRGHAEFSKFVGDCNEQVDIVFTTVGKPAPGETVSFPYPEERPLFLFYGKSARDKYYYVYRSRSAKFSLDSDGVLHFFDRRGRPMQAAGVDW